MRGWAIVAVLGIVVGDQGAQAGKCPDLEVWTKPYGRSGVVVAAQTPDLATNGNLEIIGVRGGRDFVRELATKSLVLVGAGERVPVDVAELTRDSARQTIAVVVPHRELQPNSTYRLQLERTAPPTANDRAVIASLESRSYLTGPGPLPRPEWRAAPGPRSDRMGQLYVALPSAAPVRRARTTMVCPDGNMLLTRETAAPDGELQISPKRCSDSRTNINAAFVIVEIVDDQANVSLPRRVTILLDAAPRGNNSDTYTIRYMKEPRATGSLPLWRRLFLFVGLPFVSGYAAVSFVLRSRRRRSS